ncbi:MAG: GatB/YqeY domain-containing protein [Gammaproteobacteria bacterium]|nr:GatB/YqeY domain-containing protein [Gammaproteobacteria bacterium]
MSGDELEELVRQAITETSAASMKDMGKVMGILKTRVQGRADMGALSGLVKSLLS